MTSELTEAQRSEDPDRDYELHELKEISGDTLTWTPRVYLIEGLILKTARPTSLYALPGVGKGNFAIYIALCLLNTKPVLRMDAKPVDWVGYVDGEDDAKEFGRRVVRIANGLGVERSAALKYVEVPYKINLGTEGNNHYFTDRLAQWSKLGDTGLVIYDSAQALFGGNQSTGDVGDEVYSQIKYWAQQFKHTPVVIDHTAWGAKHEYGSVFKRARVGSSIYLEQRRVMDSQNAVVDVFNKKSNTKMVDLGKDAAPSASYQITFEDHAGGRDAGPIRFRSVTPPIKNLKDLILSTEGALPGTYQEIASRIKAEPGSVQNVLGKLKKDGKVTNSDRIWNKT